MSDKERGGQLLSVFHCFNWPYCCTIAASFIGCRPFSTSADPIHERLIKCSLMGDFSSDLPICFYFFSGLKGLELRLTERLLRFSQ